MIVTAAQDCSRKRSRERVVRFVSPIIVSGLSLGRISSSIPRQTFHPQRGDAESGLAQRSLVGDVRHAFDVNVDPRGK